MDRLVKVEEREVRIDFVFGRKCRTAIHLSNLMYTMHVAFKVQASSPGIFSVKPPNGFIPPLGEYTFEVILKPQQERPKHFPRSRDRFLVKTVPAVNVCGTFPERVPAEWFAARKRQFLLDARLRVVYTGGVILRDLVDKGDIEQVLRVFKRDMGCCNSQDESGITPLHIAAANGSVNMVNLLLAAGAKKDVNSETGRCPFFEAVYNQHPSVVNFFLEYGSVNVSRKDLRGRTALHLAVSLNNLEILRILVEKEIDIEAKDRDGIAALHLAAAEGHLECVKMLVEAGADKNPRGPDGFTPMHIAADKGFANIVGYLLDAGANSRITDTRGRTPYDLGVQNGHTTLLSVMEFADSLLRAAREGNLEDIDNTLEKGAIINRGDESGWTALHCASFKGQKDVVEKLLDSGADVRSIDDEGHTPLHCAVETGNTQIVQLLIERGADVNATTVRGATPLYIACCMNWLPLKRFLQSLGADLGPGSSNLGCFADAINTMVAIS